MRAIQSTGLEQLAISAIVYGEVETGVVFSRDPMRDRLRWQRLLTLVDVLDVTVEIAEVWAQLRGLLKRRGDPLPDNDLLIAATALHRGMTVITRNYRHFARVPGLDVLVPDR
jgi:predicted nucleic acid-binding protein